MKLFRFGDSGHEKPGVWVGDRHLDVTAFGEDYDETFFANDGIQRLESWVEERVKDLQEVPSGVRFGPPFARPSKIICIGLNYSDHAKETGAAVPPEPVIFFKATSALSGPNDDVHIPRSSTKTDWEVELAVVIGKKTTYVPEEQAMSHVAGFCLHNDYSERAFQLERAGQWVKGKSCDTFAPMGPYLVGVSDAGDYGNLRLWLKVNGTIMQDGTSANLIYKIPFIVSYLSQFMSLLPGDVISTGTPAGVGMGMNPQRFLRKGDVVELGIDGLGEQKQHVHDAP